MKNKILSKLFYLNAWTVGYRKLENENEELPSREHKAKYDLIPINDHMYYADPFVFEDGDETFLFVESMNRYRGIATISVSQFQNGRFGKFKEIIKEPFHLSYPNVFRFKDEYYMIPETSGAFQIRLYRATQFPHSWELCKILLDNGNAYTDNAIEIHGDSVHLYAFYEVNGIRVTELYEMNLDSYSLTKVDSKYHLQNERPAGNPFVVNNKTFRPVQDCDEYYGKRIKIYSHEDRTDEEFVTSIDEDCFDLPIRVITGTHTLNRSKTIEVIDIKYDRFILSRRWIWLVNLFVHRYKDKK